MEFHGLSRFVAAHLKELLSAANANALAAVTLPDVERSSPITVTGDCPVLNVLQPVAKTALTDGLRDPVDGIVVTDQVILYRSLFNVPGLARIIDQRRVTSPAERIIMLELGRVKELALRVKIL